jgi:hypothetical protein
VLRDQLIAEIQAITDGEQIALWAHNSTDAYFSNLTIK